MFGPRKEKLGPAGHPPRPFKPKCYFGRQHAWIAESAESETCQCWHCGSMSSDWDATVSTATPFVNTPFGVGVIEVDSNCFCTREYYVRFEDGERQWITAGECELDAPRPDWYQHPDPLDVPGGMAR